MEASITSARSGVNSYPLTMAWILPVRSMSGIRSHWPWVKTARTCRYPARRPASSTSKPVTAAGSSGLGKTYGPPPSWSPPQSSLPSRRMSDRASADAVGGIQAASTAAARTGVGSFFIVRPRPRSHLLDHLQQPGERRAARVHLALRALPVRLQREAFFVTRLEQGAQVRQVVELALAYRGPLHASGGVALEVAEVNVEDARRVQVPEPVGKG